MDIRRPARSSIRKRSGSWRRWPTNRDEPSRARRSSRSSSPATRRSATAISSASAGVIRNPLRARSRRHHCLRLRGFAAVGPRHCAGGAGRRDRDEHGSRRSHAEARSARRRQLMKRLRCRSAGPRCARRAATRSADPSNGQFSALLGSVDRVTAHKGRRSRPPAERFSSPLTLLLCDLCVKRLLRGRRNTASAQRA